MALSALKETFCFGMDSFIIPVYAYIETSRRDQSFYIKCLLFDTVLENAKRKHYCKILKPMKTSHLCSQSKRSIELSLLNSIFSNRNIIFTEVTVVYGFKHLILYASFSQCQSQCQ